MLLFLFWLNPHFIFACWLLPSPLLTDIQLVVVVFVITILLFAFQLVWLVLGFIVTLSYWLIFFTHRFVPFWMDYCFVTSFFLWFVPGSSYTLCLIGWLLLFFFVIHFWCTLFQLKETSDIIIISFCTVDN